MLLARDIAAVCIAVMLARMAWTSGPAGDASLSASLRLAFYTRAKLVAPLDVDGDGILEAIVVASDAKGGDWELEVLDLKPLHSTASGMPFRPTTLFSTRVSDFQVTKVQPLKMTTGQIVWNHHYHHRHHLHPHSPHYHAEKKKNFVASDEPSRHYFCGKDWHDAAAGCRQNCASGSSADCPEGETCYADTPCDSMREEKELVETPKDHVLTPAGGLPTVMTYWSDGSLTVHTLSSPSKGQPLELELLWITKLDGRQLEEVHVDLLPAEDVRSSSHLGQHGMILVGGTYLDEEEDEIVSVMHAYDAMSGERMWSTPKPTLASDEALFPQVRGNNSSARRRSQIVHVQAHSDSTELPDCLKAFKQLLKGGLPHAHWGPADASVTPLHLERHKHRHSRSKKKAVHGRPNVLLSHHVDGITVRSLLNGRSLCHLSLWDRALYADLNNDGVLDQVQVVTSDEQQYDDDAAFEFVEKLAEQVKENDESQQKKRRNVPQSNRLCHVMALSGMPSREQLFTANLCGNGIARDRGDHASITIEAAPPLVVDESHIVVALNNGMISRYHVPTGRQQWQTMLSRSNAPQENVPTWGTDSMAASLILLESSKGRPVLLTGENSLMLLSAHSGKVLSSASIPQTSLDRPIVADVSGDGIPDVMIRSADAIWGYHVVVQSGASTLFRILVGLLFMGMALALLRNRFGKNHKRSTDL